MYRNYQLARKVYAPPTFVMKQLLPKRISLKPALEIFQALFFFSNKFIMNTFVLLPEKMRSTIHYGTFLKQNMPYTNKCLVYSMGQKKNDAIIASDSAPPMLVVALLATWCRDYNRM